MTKEELETHIRTLYGDDRIVSIMVDNIMALGRDGVIERNDFLSTVFEVTGFDEIDTNKEYEKPFFASSFFSFFIFSFFIFIFIFFIFFSFLFLLSS
jgi:hypothetical protein